jgi:hypothetical protein
MPKVILEGDEALQYMQNESLKDSQIEVLINDYSQAMNHIDKLEAELSNMRQQASAVSQRVLDDSEKVKGFPFTRVPKTVKQQTKPAVTRRRWTQEELNIIESTINLGLLNQDRRIEVLQGKMSDRTEQAITTKCNELGLLIRSGKIYTKSQVDQLT